MRLTREHIIRHERVSAAHFTRAAQAARDVGDLDLELEMTTAAATATQQADRLERMAA